MTYPYDDSTVRSRPGLQPPAKTVLENQVFSFDSSSTIGDLLLVANALRNAGQRPTLRLVKSYTGQLESVAVDVEGIAPSGEMACTEGAEYLPDPRD